MAQSELTQEPQFKVYGADSVKFTITEVDDELKQIHVSINCSELSTQPDDLLIDAWNLYIFIFFSIVFTFYGAGLGMFSWIELISAIIS